MFVQEPIELLSSVLCAFGISTGHDDCDTSIWVEGVFVDNTRCRITIVCILAVDLEEGLCVWRIGGRELDKKTVANAEANTAAYYQEVLVEALKRARRTRSRRLRR